MNSPKGRLKASEVKLGKAERPTKVFSLEEKRMGKVSCSIPELLELTLVSGYKIVGMVSELNLTLQRVLAAWQSGTRVK